MRIVSLLPSATEILFAVGAGAGVVGTRAAPRNWIAGAPVGDEGPEMVSTIVPPGNWGENVAEEFVPPGV